MSTADKQDPFIGTVVASRWRVEKPLSDGGMGSVYVAQHVGTGRRVALKVIKGDSALNPEMIERFKRETASLASVSHPNIVTFLDSGVENGSLFLVMELLNGSSLRASMTEPMPWPRAFRICCDVLRGLAAVHAQGLVHRDLKPENIFLQASVGHDDFAKLIDFGIVRSESGDALSSLKTKTGGIIGTPGYISAEALAGEATTHLSDLYAVGVILYELVTGAFPFAGDTLNAMLVQQLLHPVAPPSKLAAVSSEVDAIVLSLLERDPRRRPQSACDALTLLVHELARQSTTRATPLVRAEPQVVVVQPRPRNRRTRIPTRTRLGFVAAALALSLGIVGVVRGASAGPPIAPLVAIADAGTAVTTRNATNDSLAATASSPVEREAAPVPAPPTAGPVAAVRGAPLRKQADLSASVRRAAPTEREISAFVDAKRAELLACGGDRVPREVSITFAPNGSVAASIPIIPGEGDLGAARGCARDRIASWKTPAFRGASVTTTFHLALGTRKPDLPSVH